LDFEPGREVKSGAFLIGGEGISFADEILEQISSAGEGSEKGEAKNQD